MTRQIMIAALALMPLAAAAQPVDDPDVEVARRHFEAGRVAYEAHDYETALREFERARVTQPTPLLVTQPTPLLDFDIARCLDRLERWREAIDAYERFAAGAGDTADVEEARRRAEALRARVASLNTSTMPAVATTPPPQPIVREPPLVAVLPPAVLAPPVEPPRRRWPAGVVLGSGAALLVASLISGIVAGAEYTDLSAKCPASVCAFPGAADEIESRQRAAVTTITLLSIGGATAAAGVVWLAVEVHRYRDERRAVTARRP